MKLKRFLQLKTWPYWGCYLMGQGKSFRPLSLTLEITHRCNLRCRMCLFYGLGGEIRNRSDAEELSLPAWQRLVDEIAPWHPLVNISGGEPFLRGDLVELVRYIKGKRLGCGIYTNGLLASPEKLESLIKVGLDHLTFSIDGPEVVHDRIRGEKGAFERMLKNIRWAIENRLHSPIVWGICVISKENMDSLEKMVDMAKDLKLDGLQFQQVMFLDQDSLRCYREEIKGMGYEANLKDEGLGHGQEQLEVGLLIDKMKEIKTRSRTLKLPVSFLPHLSPENLWPYYQDLQWTYGRRCLIPWTNVTIAPNGDIFPCLRIKLGNIQNESLRSAWNGGRFTGFRKGLKGKGILVRCRRCCHLGEF